jgi:hypothetical protein
MSHCSMVGETAATSSLMFCFKATIVLGFFSYTCSWDIPRGRSYRHWDRAILQAIPYSLFVRSQELGTSRWGLTLQSLLCKPLPLLAEARESEFINQVSATMVPEMCEASHCSRLNLLLLPCLSCLQRTRGWSPQKMLHYTKQQPSQNVNVSGEYHEGSLLPSNERFENWHASSIMRTWLRSSSSRSFNRASQTDFDLQCLDHLLLEPKPFCKDGNLSPHAIFSALYDQTFFM